SVEENEKALNPLIGRYEELKTKNRLSNDEHIEFKDLIEKIGSLMPGVITEYDNYGKAVDINIAKVRELTKAQKELLLLREKDTIAELNKVFETSVSDALSFTKKANDLQSDEANVTK